MTKAEIRRASDPYVKVVYWDEEDRIYVGQCPELFFGGVHGRDQAKVYADLLAAVEDVVEGMLRKGQPLPRPRVMPVLRATLEAVTPAA